MNEKHFLRVILIAFSALLVSNVSADINERKHVYSEVYNKDGLMVDVYLNEGNTDKNTKPRFFVKLSNVGIDEKKKSSVFSLKISDNDFSNLSVYIYGNKGEKFTNRPLVKRKDNLEMLIFKEIKVLEGQGVTFELPLDSKSFQALEANAVYRVYIRFRKFVNIKFDPEVEQWKALNIPNIMFETELIDE